MPRADHSALAYLNAFGKLLFLIKFCLGLFLGLSHIMALPVMVYKISVYGLSDVGLVRQNNEDYWKGLKEDHFFALADGMGGHQAGEVASKQAVEALCNMVKEEFSSHAHNLSESQEIISAIIEEVNQSVYRMSRGYHELKGMGTTLCCLFFHPEGVIIGHVGDSRVYRLRNNQLEQMTRDHSLLSELIELGQLNEEQAKEFAYKNIITKAIGTERYVEPTVTTDRVQAHDMFLMCTDGLTDLLSKQDIYQIVSTHQAIEIPKKLVKAAKQKGGHDNITAVVVEVEEIIPFTEDE